MGVRAAPTHVQAGGACGRLVRRDDGNIPSVGLALPAGCDAYARSVHPHVISIDSFYSMWRVHTVQKVGRGACRG